MRRITHIFLAVCSLILLSSGGVEAAPIILDANGDVGPRLQMTRGADGFARIVYVDVTNTDYKYIQCLNLDCTAKNTTTIYTEAGTESQAWASIAIGPDTFPRIAVHNVSTQALHHIRCTNAACTTRNTSAALDSGSLAGRYSDIEVGSDGNSRIQYYKGGTNDSRLVVCGNADCSSGNSVNTVYNNNNDGYINDVQLGASDGFPRLLSYTATAPITNVFVQCTNAACTTSTITSISTSPQSGDGTMELGTDSFGRIAYYNLDADDLVFAQCTNAACSTRNTTTLDSTGDVGNGEKGMKLDASGFARISYYDTTNGNLKYAKCTNTACSAYVIATLDSTGNVGEFSDLALDTGGVPMIAYYDRTNGDLKFIRCNNADCTNENPPSVTLNAPTNLTSNSITLNAAVNPNNNVANAYFRRWVSSPGNCVDVGGMRIPVVGGDSLSGGTSQGYSEDVSGLLPGKTYYYCAIAANVGGTSYFGATATTPATFTTPAGPQNSCDVSPTSTINIGSTANCSFPGSANITGADGVGMTLSSGAALTIQSGQTVVFNTLSKPGATINKVAGGVMRKGYIWVNDADGDGRYNPNSATFSTSPSTPPIGGYVRRNTLVGVSYLSDATDCNDGTTAVNTPDCKPAAITANPVTNKTGSGATLNASANPNGDNGTRGYFKWGQLNTGECDTLESSTSASLITGTTPQNFSSNITGLIDGGTYFWCSVVFNNSGTSYGPIETFDSYAAPSVTTSAASSITNASANLNSSINPNNSSTNRRYRYGTSNVPCSSLGSVTSDSNIGSGASPVSPNVFALSVSANTTYYFCAEASNLGGTTQGSVLSFLTPPAVPTGVSATANSATQITLNWTTQTGATNYQILRCTGASCTPSAYTTDTSPTFVDTGLTCGTVYGYAMQSTNAGGNSTTSSTSYATTSSCLVGIGASNGNTNEFSDMVITSDGRPVITYRNSSTGWRVVKCADTNCTSISNDTAVANVSGTGGVQLAIMSNTFPILVFDGSSGLTAYKCSNQSCTAGTETLLLSGTNYGQWPDVVVPSDNNPVISLNNNSGGQAMVYKCSNSTCTSGSSTTIYSASASGANSKISLSSDGFPLVIYGIDSTGLGYTKCGNAACTSGNTNSTIQTFGAGSFPIYTSMTRGTDNLPFMIYSFQEILYYSKCTNAACSTRTQGTLVASSDWPREMATAMGTDNFPVVIRSGPATAKVIKCGNSACSSGNTTTTVQSGVGSSPGAFNPAIAVNSSNIPFAMWINSASPAGAKLLKCGNSTCN